MTLTVATPPPPHATSGRAVVRLALSAVVPLAFLLFTALAAIDFGHYWDDDAMFSKVRRALAPPPTLLPFAYDYPGVSFWLALSALTPEAARDPGLRHGVPDTSRLDAFTHSRTYLFRVRALYAVISSLAVLWVAGLSLAIGGTPPQAFIACALFASSWEVGYHIRWIAPDGVTAQFVAASVMCATASVAASRHDKALVTAGAVAAGLATASKYSVWLTIVPLVVAAWTTGGASTAPRDRIRAAVRVLLIAAATFLVLSPGTLLQPTLAVSQILGDVRHYGTVGHGIYTVEGGVDHARRIVSYVGAVLPAPFPIVSAGLSAAAAWGAWTAVRRDPRVGAVALLFPLLYAIYFSRQRTMIVRNLLVLAPFVAVFAAHGIRVLWDAAGRVRWPSLTRAVIVAAAVAAIASNVTYAWSAVESIRGRSADRTRAEFLAWFDRQPTGSVELSARLQAELGAAQQSARSDADIAMYAIDDRHNGIRPNEPHVFKAAFGPHEVNLNYYPDWVGDDHIVVLSHQQAIRFGVVDR